MATNGFWCSRPYVLIFPSPTVKTDFSPINQWKLFLLLNNWVTQLSWASPCFQCNPRDAISNQFKLIWTYPWIQILKHLPCLFFFFVCLFPSGVSPKQWEVSQLELSCSLGMRGVDVLRATPNQWGMEFMDRCPTSHLSEGKLLSALYIMFLIMSQ